MKPRLALVASLVLALPLVAADWPQWRGPNRDGVSKDTGLLKEWPKEGPKLLFTYREAGVGYSSPAIVGDRLYTMGARGDSEYLFALDIKDPKAVKEVWAVKIGPTFTFKGNSWGDGPRATPTVDHGLVYGLGGQGELVCADAATGDVKWRKSMPKDLGGQVNPVGGGPEDIGWGWSWSPLVEENQLVCVPGGPQGAVAALDKKTGNVLWRSKDFTDQASYASPVLVEFGHVRHYAVLTNSGLTGISPKDGSVLWRYVKKPAYADVLIPTPIVHGHFIYLTGWGAGCDLVELASADGKITAKKVYANRFMTSNVNTPVLVGKHVYGYSEGKGWVCQDFMKGKLAWDERNVLGIGPLAAADGNLYCYAEDEGTVVLAVASPEKWDEKGRFELPERTKLRKPNGRQWTPPVIANGRLYLRDQDLIFCYAVK